MPDKEQESAIDPLNKVLPIKRVDHIDKKFMLYMVLAFIASTCFFFYKYDQLRIQNDATNKTLVELYKKEGEWKDERIKALTGIINQKSEIKDAALQLQQTVTDMQKTNRPKP